MRTAIVGGTGFVGGYLIDALVRAGHDVAALVRPGSESKLRHSDEVTAVKGDLASGDALRNLVEGADAVIYCVGLLREFPRRGITFEQAQYQGVVDTVAAMRQAGVIAAAGQAVCAAAMGATVCMAGMPSISCSAVPAMIASTAATPATSCRAMLATIS